jgi:hypothetical protein
LTTNYGGPPMPFAVHNRRLFGGLALGETMTAAC